MRAILHAGTHKTGTTSIQISLNHNRAWLYERGYVYPKPRDGWHNHNYHAQELALMAQGSFDFRSRLESASGNTVILSAEEFWAITGCHDDWDEFGRPDYWERRIKYLKRVRSALRHFDEVVVFLCFRRQDEFAASLYATKILSGRFIGSFEEFRSRVKPLFDYRRQLEAFRTVFGEVRYISFDALKTDLVPAFCNWTGIPVPPERTAERHYVTPDARLVQWVYKHRMTAEPKSLSKLRRSFAASQSPSSVPLLGKATFWKSDQTRHSFLESCIDPEPGFFSVTDEAVCNKPDFFACSDQTLDDLQCIKDAFNAWLLTHQKKLRAPDVKHAVKATEPGAYGSLMPSLG
jgi:hypothetical protein